MRRSPILPNSEKGWSESANAYRQSLHEDLYPKEIAWSPTAPGTTNGGISGSYIRMGRFYSFSIVLEAPTSSSPGAYIDLPFAVQQASVFSVAVGGLVKPGIVNKGEVRLYLPDWSTSSRAVISGVAVS